MSRAAKVLREKAVRLQASAARGGNQVERNRQSEALLAIAALLDAGTDALRASLDGAAASSFTQQDRELAGTQIYGLAQRRADSATERNMSASAKEGWEIGSYGMPFHRPTLQESVGFFEIALLLHYESYWDYSLGLLHERLGDYAAAVRTFEGLKGHYTQYASDQAARCRKKAAGNYDELAELDAALEKQLSAAGKAGLATRMLGKVFGALSRTVRKSSARRASPVSRGAASAPLQNDAVERAQDAAQRFAEHLVDGDYEAAHALLAPPLAHTTADELRTRYEQMMGLSLPQGEEPDERPEDPGDASVMVMSGSADMPDLTERDLGWVYVAIHNNLCNEAVTVVVTQVDGEARIRELEWGRP